jgi:DivIVA domain-containing protein
VTWLFTLLAMAVIAVVAGVVTGRISGSMEPPVSSLPFRGLLQDRVRAADLEHLRFDAALRGYRMDQVDGVLDRLAEELARRDGEIAALRSELAEILQQPGEDDKTPQQASSLYAGDPYAEESYGPACTPPSSRFDLPTWPERGQD